MSGKTEDEKDTLKTNNIFCSINFCESELTIRCLSDSHKLKYIESTTGLLQIKMAAYLETMLEGLYLIQDDLHFHLCPEEHTLVTWIGTVLTSGTGELDLFLQQWLPTILNFLLWWWWKVPSNHIQPVVSL